VRFGDKMKDFQKNIIIERTNLVLLIKEMTDFMKSKEFDKIKKVDKELMKDQVFYMNKYLKILNKRIKGF
jgi:hypothetical protein